MKFVKLLGLICLICFTFIYTENVINVSIQQDEIMIKLKEIKNSYKINPINATIKEDTIIPGNIGKDIDIETSYNQMKKIGYFEESLLSYQNIYPEISIYNNYNKLSMYASIIENYDLNQTLDKVKKDNVKIINLVGNNGIINKKEFKNIAKRVDKNKKTG